jgi:hypothetical protein
MVFAIDEKLTSSTDVDLFRVKIWDEGHNDQIVYDTTMGTSEDNEPTIAISGDQP